MATAQEGVVRNSPKDRRARGARMPVGSERFRELARNRPENVMSEPLTKEHMGRQNMRTRRGWRFLESNYS
jgi:hypothetical protein